MKLIDLLVQELPKRGGWVHGVKHAWCDPDGEVRFRDGGCKPDFYPEAEVDDECRIPSYRHEDDPHYIVTSEQYEAAIAAAQQPVWDGEGLPPVGAQAEVSVDGGRSWCSYKATRENNGIRLVEIGNFTEEFQEYNWMFRPIRTEADKKREIGVTALAKAGGAVDFEYGRMTIDGELSSPGWYELYDKIAAGEVAGIRIE
ncbi:hypothetical protein ACI00F_003822 [Cronobacter dublinensis]